MANENDKVNFKGMTIIPSLSLNKHVSAVHNYSLQDAINMRMSNDRTHLQNIEDIINSPIIESFLNENKSIYGKVSYNDFIITNNNSFATVATTYLDSIGHDYQDEQDIYNAIRDCYANVNFSDCTLDELINLVQGINSFATDDQLSSGDEQHIEEFVRTLTILSDSKYNIIDVCTCKNELVIFVKDLDEARNDAYKNMTIIRYNEKTNVIYKAYNKYFSYYNGKLSYDYTYNVNGNLILAFCEYDTENDVKVPLKTINLNEQLYPNADINLDEDKLSIKPGIQLSNFDDVYYQSGAGYTGWHYIYIQYKINEGRYTEWYRIGFPIKLLEEAHNYLFSNDCINPKKKLVSEDITELNATIDEANAKIDDLNNGDITKLSNITLNVHDINYILNSGTDNLKHGSKYVINTGYINKTYNFDFDLDDTFYQYRIGVVIANNTNRKHFVTKFLDINSKTASFVFDINKLTEEEFIVETRQNFYNVKNILNYKNRLYVSNYITYNFGNINTDLINLTTTTVDKSDKIIPETIIDRISVGNASVYQGAFNFDYNILWLLLSIHVKKSAIGILNSLDNVQNNIIYIRKSGFRDSVSFFEDKEYACRIEDLYYEIKTCDLIAGGSTVATKSYIIIKGKDINGNNVLITPFAMNLELSSINFSDYFFSGLDGGIVQFRTSSGTNDDTNNLICCYSSGIGKELPDESIGYVSFVFAKYIRYTHPAGEGYEVDSPYINILNPNRNNFIEADLWLPINSFTELYSQHPSYFQIETHDSYIEQKQYYLTTLPPDEVFDFYIHFINKYGEISDGYRLKNTYGLYMKDNIPYVCICSNTSYYLVPANILIKYINLSETPAYKINAFTRIILNTYTSINSCPEDLKRYFQNVEFKDLYFNNLANYNFDNKFIPYYNGDTLLFKTGSLDSGNQNVKTVVVNNVTLPENAIGYFISYNKIEFSKNNIGVRIKNIEHMQYYSLLNDILDYKTFNNFYSDVNISPLIKPFTGDMIKVSVPFNNRPIYNKIFDLEVAYAGENKYGRRNKSTILTEASTLGSNISFINADINTEAYITELFNINNNFYLNEPTLYKFSNYFYDIQQNQVINTNLLGEYYDLLNIIYNELGVSYYYKIDDEESDTGHINLDIETLDASISYKNIPDNLPVALVSIKFISLHAFNIETKNNPFQIGKKMFISPTNTLNYFGQFIKECWEYDDYIFQKYDKNKQHDKFNNTILFSNVISDESIEIKWNEFLTESYKFISENKGEIINMFTLGDNIFIHCLNAIYILQFKDYLATTEESLQIIQSNIKDITYKELLPTDKGYCGLQDKEAAIVGNFGYIFYENDTNRLLRFDNNQLIYMDYPIIQWLKKFKPVKVRFANDVERNNLIIKLDYLRGTITDTMILIYDYEINAFVSRMLNSDFIVARNTKNKLYFIKDKNHIEIFNNSDKKQDEITINVINLNNNIPDARKITNKLSFVFNSEYDVIKFIENIEWNVYKYINSEDYKNSFNNPIEGHRFIYPGDYIRIYNDLIDTGWIDIEENSTSSSTKEYNSNDISKPYYRLGKYIMNLFRNVKDIKEDNYSLNPSSKTYISADDRTRLYGKWFIIEFGFNTKYYADNGKTIEFENLKVNVSQQTQSL